MEGSMSVGSESDLSSNATTMEQTTWGTASDNSPEQQQPVYVYDPTIWLRLVDPSTFVLLGIGLFTIWYGSRRSYYFHFTLTPIERTHADENMVQSKMAIVYPIIGSVFLLILYKLRNYIYYIMVIVFAFAAMVGVTYAFLPLFEALVEKFPFIPEEVSLRKGKGHRRGYMPQQDLDTFVDDVEDPETSTPSDTNSDDTNEHAYNDDDPWTIRTDIGLSFLLSLVLVALWLPNFVFSWVLSDAFAVCIGISSLTFLRIPSMKVATLVLAAFFCYDVFWVFISPLLFDSNVMVTVATDLVSRIPLPMAILLPMVFVDGPSILGLGDIVLPGFFLCFLYRFDKDVMHTSPWKGYFGLSFLCYGCGILLTLFALIVIFLQFPSVTGQPALIYLVPAVLIPAAVKAFRSGNLTKIWEGGEPDHEFAIFDDELGSPNLSDNEAEEEYDPYAYVDDGEDYSAEVVTGVETGGYDDA